MAFAEGDIDTAREHFLKDLDYSERVGDIAGQAKMYSSVGGCDIEKENFSSALEQYEKSEQLAESVIDKFFALTGKLDAAFSLGKHEIFHVAGESLLAVARQAGFVPKDCAGRILNVLTQYGNLASLPWSTELAGLSRKAIEE